MYFLPVSGKIKVRTGLIGLGLMALAWLSGCTTQLKATAIDSQTESVTGQIYFLPRVDYLISLDRELKQCTFAYPSESDAVIAWLKEGSLQLSTALPESNPKDAFTKLTKDPVLGNAEVAAAVEHLLPNWRVWTNNKELAERFAKLAASSPGALKLPSVLVKVEMRATATPLLSQDLRHVYAIRYQGMQEWTKGTDYSVETYPNGTLKSINVNLDDQTGVVLQNTINGVVKVASAASGIPLPALLGKSLTIPAYADWKKEIDKKLLPQNPCSSQVQLALLQRKALGDASDGAADVNLELARVALAAETALGKAVGARDEQQALLDSMTPEDKEWKAEQAKLKGLNETVKLKRKDLAAAQTRQEAALEASGKLDVKLATVRKSLTKTTALTMILEGGAGQAMQIDGIDDAFNAWFDKTRTAALCSPPDAPCTAGKFNDVVAVLQAQAAVPATFSRQLKVATEDARPALNGQPVPMVDIVYRQPVPATLFVCKEQPCLDDKGKPIAAPANRLLMSPVSIPQLGLLASLPLRNGPFQNNTLGASFAENGALTKATYKSNAAAVKASAVFESSADTLFKFKDAKRKEATSKLTLSKDELTARTNLLKAQLDYEKAQADLDQFRLDEDKQK